MTFWKTFKRIVFSRTMVTFLLILIQLLLLFSSFIWLNKYIEFIVSAMYILGAVLVIYLINIDEKPEFKLAWIIPLCTLPVFGGLLYLFVTLNYGFIGMKKQLRIREYETGPLRKTADHVRAGLEKDDPRMANLARYMQQTGGYPCYSNSQVTYFPLGEDKYEDMLLELENAGEFIFLEYFIVEPGVMWDSILEILKKKAAQGVEVRFMYDGMCSVMLLPYKYPEKMKEYGIQCKMFAPIVPMLSTHQNNRDHRKILVIDGKIAYTGGVNLADEYINRRTRFGHWKDTAVKIKGDAVDSFTLMFLQMWNITSGKEVDEYARYLRPHERLGEDLGYVIPYGDDPVNGEDLAENVYLDIIQNAVSYVHIMTPYLIMDSGMLDALKYAAMRGVDVKLILPHIPDKKTAFSIARNYYPALLKAGIHVYEYTPGFVHAKVFTSDDCKAVVGTINLDYRSLYHHFECAAYIYKNPVVAEVEQDYQETLEKCREVDMAYYKSIPAAQRLMGALLKLIGPLM